MSDMKIDTPVTVPEGVQIIREGQIRELGQIAFDAYNKDRGGVNHLGKKTPDWEELPHEIQHAWNVGASAVWEIANKALRPRPDGGS